MARVTIEDCIDKIDNRFELILLASFRARLLTSGARMTIEQNHDKYPVCALREIGDGTIAAEDLKEQLIHSMQKYVEVDEPENDPNDPQFSPDIRQDETNPLLIQDDSHDHFNDTDKEEDLIKEFRSSPVPKRPFLD